MTMPVAKYLGAIRHRGKKNYARDFYHWLQSGEKGEQPNYSDYGIQYMTAQAVRLQLSDLIA